MDNLSRDQLTEALAEVLRESLENDESLHVPALGTFRTQHRLSQIEKQDDGQIVMTPPQDTIVFEPEKRS